MKSRKGLIIALDADSPVEARRLVARLGALGDFYKLPPALVLRDPSLIGWLRRRGKKTFLDCKWYDIPSQVRRSVEEAGRLGVTACTVHLGGGREMLKAALAARPRPLIWGVSVLTSFAEKDLKEVGVGVKVPAQVLRLARLGRAAGVDGMVCSPRELRFLKKSGIGLKFVTPGITWGGAAAKDQKRTASPARAWADGADWIVVGRSVLEAPDPRKAVRDILHDR